MYQNSSDSQFCIMESNTLAWFRHANASELKREQRLQFQPLDSYAIGEGRLVENLHEKRVYISNLA